MKSIRTKISLITLSAIIVTMLFGMLIGYIAVSRVGQSSASDVLLLMCESGQKNLNTYFGSVERSVAMVSSYAENDLLTTDPADLQEHVDRVSSVFARVAGRTNGILTYYYRIDPEYSSDVPGFWFVNHGRRGFIEHETTDLTAYENYDAPGLVWFNVPRVTGEPVWLPPYVTENLDARVLSYNVPIYQDGEFVGVIGIELDYTVMANQVDNIRLYENGYAFINDDQGNIIYHPYIDVTSLPEDQIPKTPEGLVSNNNIVNYEFDGVEKIGCWLELTNGMRLNVSVPVSEIDQSWMKLLYNMTIVLIIIMLLSIIFIVIYTDRLTHPLRELTHAAEKVNDGDYNVSVVCRDNDEIGVLAATFNKLVGNVKSYIYELSELNKHLADDNRSLEAATIRDSLTGVRNRFALRRDYDKYENRHIHIMMLDIDDFKKVNDTYGHSIGDYLLKNVGIALIDQFGEERSYRYGGDEFLVIAEGYEEEAFRNTVVELEKQLSAIALEEQKFPVHFSAGYVYGETTLNDDLRYMLRQADELLYKAKAQGKNAFIGAPYDREYAEHIKKKEEDAFRHG